MSKKKKKKTKHRGFRIFFWTQFVFLLLILGGLAYYFFGGYAEQVQALQIEAKKIAKASTEADFVSDQTSIVYDANGGRISVLKGEKDSYYLTYDEIPYNVKAAIVSIEDKRFYEHNGIDYKAIVRAAIAMFRNGEITQGGSTITQQLARNIYLTQDKTWERKMEEIFLAQYLEQKYSKEQILEFYLNNIYFANGYYGIEAASRGYFSKTVSQLSLSEQAFLLAIPNNPSYYNPITEKEHTLARRDRILKNMLEDDVITNITYEVAISEEITLNQTVDQKRNYVETYAYYCATRALMEVNGFVFESTRLMSDERKEVYEEAYEDMYRICQRELYTGGYRIYTSLDLSVQELLQSSIDEELASFEDVNEEGVYAMQGSGVCINNTTGYVVAIVGGRSQELEGYTLNRAYQSFRQPGSSIKPLIVYTPALEAGYTPDSIVVDEEIEDGPENAGDVYSGEMTLREAVARSKNTIAWKLFEEITPAKGLSYLDSMMFTHVTKADERMASALGGFSTGCSSLEMASAYATLENDGNYRSPSCIMKITDADGNVIYQNEREEVAVYKTNAARMMTSMLQTVMESGTGAKMSLGEMPAAGKTGTTNDNKDGWFVGYTNYYTTAIWVGYDMPKTVEGLSGNSYPGYIWQNFMLQIHEGLTPVDFRPYVEYPDLQKSTESTEETMDQESQQEEEEEEEAAEEEAVEEEVEFLENAQ